MNKTVNAQNQTQENIEFILNDKKITLASLDAGTADAMPSLLNYIRNAQKLTGTKEGCAEGDCGACTVIIASLEGERLQFKAMNSCIIFPAAINGKAVLTVEYLKNGDALHPLQQEFANKGASQCGFCTPGFVMSAAAARFDDATDNSKDNHCNIIAGNLCRCTGYGPILKAMQSATKIAEPKWMQERFAKLKAQLKLLQNNQMTQILQTEENISYIPKTIDALAETYHQNPDATLIAGSTDVGLWASKKLLQWKTTIHINQIDALGKIEDDGDCYKIGAGVSLQDFMICLIADYPALSSYMNRFASTPIRQSGTVCGNLANGSPIGDLPPLLMAMGATLHLRKNDKTRTLLLQDFFIAYGKQNISDGEFISHVIIPKITTDYLRAYKVSKRFEQDISAVAMGINMVRDGDIIKEAIICYGGMAGTPKRAEAVENYLNGKNFTLDILQEASAFLTKDFAPLSDMRASAAYRMHVAQQLFIRYYYDVMGDKKTWQQLHGTEFDFLPLQGKQQAKDTITVPKTDKNHIGQAIIHDSAPMQVSGQADYTDDLPLLNGTLHMALVTSKIPHGDVTVMMADDIFAVTADDITGKNTLNPVWGDDPIFSDKKVEYVGQPIMGVLADSHDNARKLARDVKVHYKEKPAILTIDKAFEEKSYISAPVQLKRGNAEQALTKCDETLTGEFEIGGQEHFYLEGQIAYAIPQDDEMLIYSSTQHPSEIQHVVAGALGLAYHKVRVVVRRMGGGFGGKESQANLAAVASALAAQKYQCPVKLRFDRDDDMMITGKRHNFKINYQIGFTKEGLIEALHVTHKVQCGFSYDLSMPVSDRAMCHSDNAYYVENFDLISYRLKTNTVSNTAFRGFGGPQGMLGMERMIEHVAFHLEKDPVDIRMLNLYDAKGKQKNRCTTPYQMEVADNILHEMMPQLMERADYRNRREAIQAWNKNSSIIKRGIAISPVKFGISFTLSFLNQAGALIHIYQDGSVKINHGGTEMGQGLNIKCAQVTAQMLQIPLSQIQITATDTDKVPNTSATAASAGTDLNGMAIQEACKKLINRLNQYLAKEYDIPEQKIIWKDGVIICGKEKIKFSEVIKLAYMAKISLSATGYYSTPKINWDNKKFAGRPFYYFSYGTAISEVMLDTLTGELRHVRCDISHDVGNSLSPAIDLGQIEGAYIQGVGWLTSEELVFDDKGVLRTHAPSTYKIPTAFDRPHQMNISLYPEGNQEETIYRSKAVGEPPLMLAISNFLAVQDAIASIGDYKIFPNLHTPATPEQIVNAVHHVRSQL